MRRKPWMSLNKIIRDDKDFVYFSISLPREQFEFLTQKSEELKKPIGRLISYLVDLERDQEPQNQFFYPIPEATTVFIEDAYIEEAGKIFRFLIRFKDGLSRDNLLLFRRSIGIPDKLTMVLGIRELLNKKRMAVETFKKPGRQIFEFDEKQTWIKLSRYAREQHEEDQKKIAAREEGKIDDKILRPPEARDSSSSEE